MMTCWTRNSRQRGIAMVELTIVMPLMLFLILAVAELGFAFMQYNTLTHAVRDATRYVAGKALRGQSQVVNIDGATSTAAKNLVVYGTETASGNPILPNLNAGDVTVANAGGGDITITVSYDYQPLIGTALPGFLGGAMNTQFTMQSQVTMKAI